MLKVVYTMRIVRERQPEEPKSQRKQSNLRFPMREF
jgi:hypothetical protein